MEQVITAPRPRWNLWCSTVTLGILGTALLYQALPGINWALATLAASLGFLVCCAIAAKQYRARIALPLALACLISAGAPLTADPLDDLLIAAAVLLALGSAVVATYADTHVADERLRLLVAAPLASVLTASEAGRQFTETVRAVRAGRSIAVIRGIVVAAPLTVVLARLLSEADPTLAAAREFVIHLLREFPIVPRAIFCGVLTACLLGAFGIALHAAPAGTSGATGSGTPRRIFGDTERLIVLGSIATLFAVFLMLQLSYLFGDPGGRRGSGVSYAEAVHRGFVELNVASTICCAVLLSLRRYASDGRRSRWTRVLEWIVTIQAQILLVSAFDRVSLYEGAYGFTRLRLYVQVYAALAFITFIFLSIELRGCPSVDRLLRRVMAASAVALWALIALNSDAWIAHANVARFERTGRIDVPYLTNGLGPDAVPQLVAELPRLPDTLAAHIKDCLRVRYQAPGHFNQERWFEWSLRRMSLHRALTAIGDDQAGTRPAGGAPCR
jgi:two-component system, OmpR family, sensor histidine kinase BaeS